MHGRVSAVLSCDTHEDFWNELVDHHTPTTAEKKILSLQDLSKAWEAMPLVPEERPDPRVDPTKCYPAHA